MEDRSMQGRAQSQRQFLAKAAGVVCDGCGNYFSELHIGLGANEYTCDVCGNHVIREVKD